MCVCSLSNSFPSWVITRYWISCFSQALSLLVTINLFSMSVSLFLFCLWVHLYHFLDSTHKWYYMMFVFVWLNFVWFRPSTLLQMALMISFFYMVEWHLVGYIYHIFFIHSPVFILHVRSRYQKNISYCITPFSHRIEMTVESYRLPGLLGYLQPQFDRTVCFSVL